MLQLAAAKAHRQGRLQSRCSIPAALGKARTAAPAPADAPAGAHTLPPPGPDPPTSAVRYSRMAAVYTAAVAPTRPLAVARPLSRRWIRPTGNCRPARAEREMGFFLSPPAPLIPMVPLAPCDGGRGVGRGLAAAGACQQQPHGSPAPQLSAVLHAARLMAPQLSAAPRVLAAACPAGSPLLQTPSWPLPRWQLGCGAPSRSSCWLAFEPAAAAPPAAGPPPRRAPCPTGPWHLRVGGRGAIRTGGREQAAARQALLGDVLGCPGRPRHSPLPDMLACAGLLQPGEGRAGGQGAGRRRAARSRRPGVPRRPAAGPQRCASNCLRSGRAEAGLRQGTGAAGSR